MMWMEAGVRDKKAHEMVTNKKNTKTRFLRSLFLYPAADDEFDRFESCRTGIRDGRLVINPEQKDIRGERKKSVRRGAQVYSLFAGGRRDENF